MPTAFPRAVVYNRAKACHFHVVVRKDKGYFKWWCVDHDTVEDYPLSCLEEFKAWMRELEDSQVVSWLEVSDDGS